MENSILKRLEEKRQVVERALAETTDPNLVHEYKELLDHLTMRLSQSA